MKLNIMKRGRTWDLMCYWSESPTEDGYTARAGITTAMAEDLFHNLSEVLPKMREEDRARKLRFITRMERKIARLKEEVGG